MRAFHENGICPSSLMLALSCAVFAAALAGFSRGFAAFGTAMIYVPLMTFAYDAKTAVVTLFLVDLLPALPLIWSAAPHCDRRTLSWMGLGAIALSPVGVALLLIADPARSQFILGAILLFAVTYMVLRPDFRIAPSPVNSIGAGAVSGLAGGLCGIFGPPATIYLLGRGGESRNSRADTIVYLTGESVVLGITYGFYGLYTRWYIELSAMLMPIYGLCMWYGARKFSHTGEAAYRRLMLGLLWVIAAVLVIKPLFAMAADLGPR
ncbi:MAG: sulfite exporter TauE/SafE family protein [Alphaproteobacteria bacterium]|nr:sulfite exporter TauE/SafE family protein [Alphaproteobacteria bacterium]